MANSKHKVVSSTQKVVRYAPKYFGYDRTLYWILGTVLDRSNLLKTFKLKAESSIKKLLIELITLPTENKCCLKL